MVWTDPDPPPCFATDVRHCFSLPRSSVVRTASRCHRRADTAHNTRRDRTRAGRSALRRRRPAAPPARSTCRGSTSTSTACTPAQPQCIISDRIVYHQCCCQDLSLGLETKTEIWTKWTRVHSSLETMASRSHHCLPPTAVWESRPVFVAVMHSNN